MLNLKNINEIEISCFGNELKMTHFYLKWMKNQAETEKNGPKKEQKY